MVMVVLVMAVRLMVRDVNDGGLMRHMRRLPVPTGKRIGRMIFVTMAGLAARVPLCRSEDRDQAGKDRAEKRKEDDRRIHAPQPFIMLMSSTAMEPRFR